MTDERPPTLEELDALRLGPAPVRDLLAAGHHLRRRRRAVLASVAVAVVVVAGVSVANAGSSSTPTTKVDAAADRRDSPDLEPFPDPPSGTKWVGASGVVVAVPSDWFVIESACRISAPLTKVVSIRTNPNETNPNDGCEDRIEAEAVVTFAPYDAADRNRDDSLLCKDPVPPVCYASTPFPDQDVTIRFRVTGLEAGGQIADIRATAMVLPDGWTTVPFGGEYRLTKRSAVLRKAGFEVDDSRVLDTPDQPVSSEPDSGSPVRDGATITLARVSRDSEPHDLTVVVHSLGYNNQGLPTGVASWDATTETVTFRPRTPDRCRPVGTATRDGSSVGLSIVRSEAGCGAIPEQTSLTISGLTEAPIELTVTEEGETQTVPVLDVATTDDTSESDGGSLCPDRVAYGQRSYLDRDTPPPGVSLEEALDPYPGATVVTRRTREALATLSVESRPLRVIELNRWSNGSWAVSSVVACTK